MTRSYTVRGQTYQPMSVDAALDFEETGTCSWYNESKFFGLKRGTTSLGEKVMPWHLIGAHKTLPLPCLVKVTNLENGKSVKIRINDRGPFIADRVLDVSPRAAKKLGFRDDGLTTTHMEVHFRGRRLLQAQKDAAGSSSESSRIGHPDRFRT